MENYNKTGSTEPTTNYQHQNISQTKPQKSTGLIIGLSCCAVAAAASLGFGIFNLLQNNNLSSTIDSQNTTIDTTKKELSELKSSVAKLVEESNRYSEIEFKCIAPASVDDIWSINIQNGPNSEYYIDPGSNEIRYITYTKTNNEETSSDKTVITNPSDIIQHVYDNTQGSLTDPDYSTDGYNWYVSIDGADNSTCMAAGQDAAPAWFNTLIDMLKARENS